MGNADNVDCEKHMIYKTLQNGTLRLYLKLFDTIIHHPLSASKLALNIAIGDRPHCCHSTTYQQLSD